MTVRPRSQLSDLRELIAELDALSLDIAEVGPLGPLSSRGKCGRTPLNL
jgi:hypothetical protein